MDTLRTMPPLAAPGHLDMGHRVIVLPGAKRMKFITSSKKPLHHYGIGCCRIGIVLAKELHQS